MLGNLYQVLFYYTTALLIGSIETKIFFIFRLGYLLNLLPFFIFCIQWGQNSFEALQVILLENDFFSNSQIKPSWGVCPFKGTT